VQDLRYRSNDSLVLWTPGTPQQVAFTYRLSLASGEALRSGRLTRPALHLPGLAEGGSYVLELLEECDPGSQSPEPTGSQSPDPAGPWSPDPAVLRFQVASIPMRPRGPALEGGLHGTPTTKYSVG